jgi:hypothetical protein
MPTHKSEYYKLSDVEYYSREDKTQEEVCKIFKCSTQSLLIWLKVLKVGTYFIAKTLKLN